MSYQRTNKLVYTTDLLILRIKKEYMSKDADIKSISTNFLKSLFPTFSERLKLIDSYPEADVTVWKVLGSRPEKKRQQIINSIRESEDAKIAFVGRVRMRSDTKVYQIYTGNMFLYLHPGKEDSIHKLCQLYDLRLKQERVAKLQFSGGAFYLESINESHHIFDIADRLINNHSNLVSIAEPELIIKRKTFIPDSKSTFKVNPTQTLSQLSPTSSGTTQAKVSEQSWISKRTRLFEAQQITKGSGTKLAIIDDGIESSHPAFQTQSAESISQNFLGSENDTAEHQYREEKHGTACASIAVSSDQFAPGVAPEAQLLVARTKGLGSILEAEAISWAANNGADVISCSWGPADGDPSNPNVTPARHPLPAATKFALKYAAEEGRNKLGCLIVFAAGNGNEPLSPDEYANNPYVIAVGSTNKRDRRASYSDYGPELFCCFPSSDVRIVGSQRYSIDGYSTADRLGELGYSEGDYFHCFGGTSAAAPAVAGVAALVLSISPHLKVKQLRHLLRVSCHIPNGVPGEKNDEYGYGILDALVAVKLAQKLNGVSISEEYDGPYERLVKLSPELEKLNFTKPQKRTTMKNKAVSLHIGVNKVDPNQYPNYTVPPLAGCVNDAEQWMSYAESVGYENPLIFTDEKATRKNVIDALKNFASILKSGDICLLTYAGHGSQIPTDDPDEKDNFDETWLLYDGIFLDDEIDISASDFKEGVRFVIISDSCHSGTVSRNTILSKPPVANRDISEDRRERKVDTNIARSNYQANPEIFKEIKKKASTRKPTKAYVKLLPGCQDQQTSKEVNGEGVFTKTLLDILKKESKVSSSLNYNELLATARKELTNFNQHPIVYDSGERSSQFDNQYPLDISPVFNTSEIIEPIDAPSPNSENISFAPGEDTPNDNKNKSNIRAEKFEIIIEKHDSTKNSINNGLNSLTNYEYRTGTKIANIPRDLSVPYDQAYELLASNNIDNIKYVEIDQPIKVGVSPQQLQRSSPPISNQNNLGFMETYSFPNSDHPDRIIWHLGNNFTQLRKASLFLHPEIGIGQIPVWNPNIPRVAMIDTGIRYDYPTIPPNLDIEAARSFTKKGKVINDENATDRGIIPEKHGHGTATANLLAGGFLSSKDSPDGIWNGIIGAAPQMKIIPLRISESVVILSAKAFAEALNYAVNINVDVVSMSMAGAPSNKMAEAINNAYLKGVVVVCAGGNQWSSGVMGALPDALMYPARFERVIAAVGVAFDGRPYRADLTTSDVQARSEGGETMGSCYGPEDSNKSVLAAYTPNTIWAGGDGDKTGKTKATMDGGGTSTATPQIAAAAAMWLELHGEALDEAIGAYQRTAKGRELAEKSKYGLKWMRVEAVRYALFNSAKKEVGKENNKHYDHLYGNGVLQAYEALRYKPIFNKVEKNNVTNRKIKEGFITFDIRDLTLSDAADLSLGGFIDSVKLIMSAYRAFGKRTRSVNDSADSYTPSNNELNVLHKTIVSEIYSLLYSIEELRPFRANPFPKKQLDPELARALLKNDEKLSFTLRNVLSPYAIKESTNRKTQSLSRGSEIIIPELYALQASTTKSSNASKIIVIADQVGIEVKNKTNKHYEEANDLQYEEFEINVNTEQLRKIGISDPLKVILKPANTKSEAKELHFGALATLIERYDEQGNLIDYEWQYQGNKIVGTRNLATHNTQELGPGLEFNIDLRNNSQERGKGEGKLIKRIIGKVFKLFIRNKEGKFGKEVHRSYQLRNLDLSASTMNKRLGHTIDITDINKRLPNINNLGSKKKTLILIHGMFATTESSFGKLLTGNDKIIEKLKNKYGGRVFAFEHPSVVESIDSNFEYLKKLKGLCKDQTVDIIATSRGTHLARRMKLSSSLLNANSNPLFNIDKAMYIGGTTFGTDIAQEDKTVTLLKRITGILTYSSRIFGPQIASVVKLLEKIITKAGQEIINLPGINDQVPNSPVLRQINNAYKIDFSFDNPNDLWVGANWQPSKDKKLVARLIDKVADANIFGATPSDGVAPLPGAVGIEPKSSLNPSNNRIILNPTDTNHFTYFLNDEVLDGIKRHF